MIELDEETYAGDEPVRRERVEIEGYEGSATWS